MGWVVVLWCAAGLGEHKIRDLNDHINKLMREKRAWEHQIKALGGNDYLRDGARITDADGKRAFGTDV
jgi:pre-mRNA-splicing factor ISY1